jgi:hypothetical protein
MNASRSFSFFLMQNRILARLDRSFALLAVLAFAASPAFAATQTDRWSTAGDAWDDAYQTSWVSANTLKPDAASDFGAILHASARPSPSGLAPTGGLYDTFYYTFFTAPTLTLSTDNVLAGLETITFEFSYAAGLTSVDAIGLVLNYNAAYTGLAPSTFTAGSGETISTVFGPQTFTAYSFTWNVASLGATDEFSIVWNLGAHNSFNGVALTQADAASSPVPEPSAFAALAGFGALGLAITRRRRS